MCTVEVYPPGKGIVDDLVIHQDSTTDCTHIWSQSRQSTQQHHHPSVLSSTCPVIFRQTPKQSVSDHRTRLPNHHVTPPTPQDRIVFFLFCRTKSLLPRDIGEAVSENVRHSKSHKNKNTECKAQVSSHTAWSPRICSMPHSEEHSQSIRRAFGSVVKQQRSQSATPSSQHCSKSPKVGKVSKVLFSSIFVLCDTCNVPKSRRHAEITCKGKQQIKPKKKEIHMVFSPAQ